MTPAERTRLYRLRDREGIGVLRIAVHVVEVAELMRLAGYLDRDADDRNALTAAVEAYLADMSEPADPERDASRRAALRRAILET